MNKIETRTDPRPFKSEYFCLSETHFDVSNPFLTGSYNYLA